VAYFHICLLPISATVLLRLFVGASRQLLPFSAAQVLAAFEIRF
jgi:hypothetical protein